MQNLLLSNAKERDHGDVSSDTAKLRPRQMTSIKDPDESDDFSGGTTPYRIVIHKNLEKMEKLKKLNKINKKNLKRKKTKSSDEPIRITQVADCDSEHLKSEIMETNHGTPEDACKENSSDKKKCVTCQEHIKTSEFSDHRRDCLSKKFTRGSGNVTAVQRTVGLHYCQICQQDITNLNTEDRSSHVNFCIDQAASRSVNEASSAREDGSKMVCHVCKKDLSRFNSQRKMQHINRCIDQVEEAEKQQRDNQAALEKARNKVLDCPLCGQHLKTANGRRTHLKKCATKYGVSPLVLQERIKQQEEEYAQKLESGVIPLQPELKKRKRNHIKSSSSTMRPEEPLSKVDADMQLAVALSESIQQPESQVTTDNEKIDEHKNAFSILMTPKMQKHIKRKPKQKSVSALMVANEQNVARRLSERVGKLLLPQENDKIICTPKFPQSNVCSGKMSSLWEKGVHVSFDIIQYYVKDLMPPLSISTVECGSKLRRLSSIPGRDVTIYEATPSKSEHNKSRIDLNNTTMIATTQTALLLAEMDADLKEKNCDTEKHFDTTVNEPDLNATGFILPEDNEAGSSQAITASYERLIKEQEKMINNRFLSDISLETRDGVVYAHKYALVVRCPTLLKSIEKVSKVDLQDFSKDAALALLRYLYIYDMSPKNSVAEELEKLASRFGLVELVNVCKDILAKSDVAEEREEFNQTQSSVSDLDALLKKVWGSDESSSDEESGERKDDDLEREEAEIEAVYEFMASQKLNSPKVEASSGEEDSSESNDDDDADDLSCESQSRMKKLKCPNKTRLLQEDILKELLSPESEESKGICAVNENVDDKEDMKLYMEESDGGDTVDDNFGGSPLVRIMKQCKERKSSEEDADFNTAGNNTRENAFESVKNVNDVGDLPSPHDKFTVLLCEKCPLDRTQLNKFDCDSILGKVVMTRSDFNTTSKERPEIKLCSITICDKAQSVHVGASDKEVMSRSASRTLNFTTCLQRKKPYETPVGSRTFSVTESVTPDLFDTSTATEEYSMDVSFRSLNKEKTSKYSGSSSRLFSDDEPIPCGERIPPKQADGNVVKELGADVRKECEKPVRETEKFETPNSSKVADSAFEDIDGIDSDGVMVLTQEEIAALPKSRTPSPVFCSQTSQADKYEMGTYIDQSVVKLEKETSQEKVTQSDSCDEEGISEPDWIQQHTPNSHKSKKVYSFKRRNFGSKAIEDQNTQHSDSSTRVSGDVGQRKSRCLSLSQKRKKRKSSSSSLSSSSSNAEKKLRVNRVTPNDESQNNSQSVELHRSLADDEAIDLTQDESPDGHQENVDFVGENQNYQNEVVNSFDDIPWQDDGEDGVLVMYDPEELSPVKEGSSIKVNKKAKHGQRLLDGSFFDPPTDMETEHSVLYDSMAWNEDNEPKELSSSQNMMKTPSAPVPQKAKKPLSEWFPPSPFTPMPPYDSMTTPELKQHCKKYGIRALPKKRMKATLKTIHMETHQWKTDSEFEDGEREQTPKRSQTSLKTIQKKTKDKYSESMKGNRTKNQHSDNNSYDAVEVNDLDSSSSSLPELLEESMMPEIFGRLDEDQGEEITPSQIHASPKTKEQRAQARKEKIFAQMKNYVRGNIKLYEKVLQYEVFEFDDFKADLNNAGIKVGNGILVDFLDEMNIQFTWRNHQQVEKEKQGKGSPSKRGRARRGRGKRKGEVS